MQNAVFDAFTAFMMPVDKSDIGVWYKQKFYAYGLFGLLDGWVENGFKETPGEMKNMLESAGHFFDDVIQ